MTAARRELCDVQHALTGECAAAHMPARRAQDDGVAKLQSMAAKEVRRVAMQGKETQRDSMRSITQVLQGARRATQRGVHGVGHTITAADFACLRQLLASALPEHEPCGEGGGGGAAFTAAKVDTVLRNMRHHAKEQVHRIASAAQPEVHRRKQAEEARGWLTVVLRAWQEAAQDAHAHAAREAAPARRRAPCASTSEDAAGVRPRRSKRVRRTVNGENREEAVNTSSSYKLQLVQLSARRELAKSRKEQNYIGTIIHRCRALHTYLRVMGITLKGQTRTERLTDPPAQDGQDGAGPPVADGGHKRTRREGSYREARSYTHREGEHRQVRRRVQGTALGINLLHRLWGIPMKEDDLRRRTRKRPRTPRIRSDDG